MTFSNSLILLLVSQCLLIGVDAFVMRQHLATHIHPSSQTWMFFAGEAPKQESSPTPESDVSDNQSVSLPIDLVASDDEKFLNMVGVFLVDSFWLNSEHHRLGDTSSISSEARMGLVVEQCADLQEKYGETMGKRLFNSCVLGALDPESKKLLGAATIKASLLMNDEILESEKAEALAKNAVASLGPKERRVYKDASISTIATELMSADTKAICVLSNLAVSTEARRRGIARTICEEAQGLASDWGFDSVYLVVEKENESARKLYEDRLGYTVVFEKEAATAVRADMDEGTFTEIVADTLILSKSV